MSMNDRERLECLIDHCNAVIERYQGLIEAMPKPDDWFRPWDDFRDALETIEEGMK